MKILRVLKYLLVGIYLACAVMLVLFMLPKTGWKLYRVATGSMEPTIHVGSVVIDHQLPPRNYQVGDIVTYINPANPQQTITHRIIKKSSKDGIPTFVTKGDANNTADKQIIGGNIIGQVKWKAPYVGKLLEKLHQPLWFILVIIIPALLIIIDEIFVLRRSLKSSTNSSSHHNHSPPTPSSPQKRSNNSVDTIIKHSIFLLIVIGLLTTGITHAALSSKATLTNNRLTVNNSGNNGTPTCSFGNLNVSISNTGPGSINRINIRNRCRIIITNNTTVIVTNNNNQNVSSGNASSSRNTNGGSATSGTASANNNSSNSVNINQPTTTTP